MDELNHGTVDIFIAALSQVQGDRSGPIGRIVDLKNGLATHYDPGKGLPRRIKVKQRNGFGTLTTNGHSATSGATSNPSWSNPELLSSIGNQVLSIANAIPRVYDGSDWTHYAEERVVSNILSESVFHTSQHTICADDSATIGGVTCSVWSERTNPQSVDATLYIGFRSDDGAWIRTPQILYDPNSVGDHIISIPRVEADTEGVYFWVVFDSLVASADKFTVKLFDLNGKEVNSLNVAKVQDVFPSYWDITQIQGGGIFHAQPLHTIVSATDGVKITKLTQAAGVISSVVTNNADIHCRGQLAWVESDLDDDMLYLATIGQGEDPSGKLWGYQIDPVDPDPATHEFDFEVFPAANTIVDSLIGFASQGVDPDEPSLTVSFTLLQTQPQTVGPPFDPQLRYSKCYTCTWGNVVTLQRQNDYTCQVSRAFKHDDEWYSINYYQSGSGNSIQSTKVTPDFTPGDYIIGSKEQPISVREPDATPGSPKTHSGAGPGVNNINTTQAIAPFSILSGDTVESVSVNIHALGTRTLLKWTLANLSIFDGDATGGRITIDSSTGVTGANGTWDIVGADPNGNDFVYTSLTSTLGGALIPGTFGASGTAEIVSMTEYRLPDLGISYDNQTKEFLFGGDALISDNGTPANNGHKTILRTVVGWTAEFDPYGLGPGVWIETGSESSSDDGFTAILTPGLANQWGFSGEFLDDSLLIGPHTLIVENSAFVVRSQQFSRGVVNIETAATNDSSGSGYSITGTTSPDLLETDGSAITAQIFKSPFPRVTIRVPDDVTPYTFFIQDVDPDYTYLGAQLIVSGDTTQPTNNGVYTITDFDTAGHLLYTEPADGNTKQRSQLFHGDEQTITIVFQTNVQPEFQPCWLMVPLTGTKPVVGRFEYQLAFADWRFEGETTPGPNLYPLSVTSVVRGSDGLQFVLPYRAVSFTVGQSIATTNGQVVNAAIASNQSTVGTKQFKLRDTTGVATSSFSKLMIPGPMCAEFTASGFNENGVNFGFEAPFLVSQQESDNNAALRKGGSYQVVAVAEVQEEDGDRVFSIVSPPLNFTLTGDNNSATYGLRMLQPFDSNGKPIAKHFGVTNRRLVGISYYRTSYQNDTPTTDHHKITLDLNVNGLDPVSNTNDSGFSFPDEFTSNYLDENIDAAIVNNEILYTDKGFLPRFSGPASRSGDFWRERTWLVGYDDAIWMSAEKKEGDATWYFPVWRIFLPTTDKPVAVAEMDDYLIIGCERSMWYLPAATFPNATGREGSLPNPVQLPFTNGCTGHMVTLRNGVAYSSTDGGVWLITRSLTNEWFSQTVQDTLGTAAITSMTIDKHQRLFVATNTGNLVVYDQIIGMWYNRWSLPTSGAKFLTTFNGEPVFQDSSHVWLYDTEIFHDTLTGSPVAIPLDVTFSSFNFGGLRSVKSLWALQIVGDYKGPHHLNAILSYPDDFPDEPTVFPDPDVGPYTPDPDLPYLMEINPMFEQASSFGLRIFTDFDGIAAENFGNSAEIELISCEVGIDASTGLNKMRDSQRITGR